MQSRGKHGVRRKDFVEHDRQLVDKGHCTCITDRHSATRRPKRTTGHGFVQRARQIDDVHVDTLKGPEKDDDLEHHAQHRHNQVVCVKT